MFDPEFHRGEIGAGERLGNGEDAAFGAGDLLLLGRGAWQTVAYDTTGHVGARSLRGSRQVLGERGSEPRQCRHGLPA
jgi:hypothetical protein